ncbi:splicing factor U2AF [Musa troglodytarum]|uniref:Splicing factor U2AF n=1 Tax=Musa troglodytarum TaxID=320322 RepID=A0A9E7H164_9LILI|nr:splicing factor U2AF [Musa troglodytarum]
MAVACCTGKNNVDAAFPNSSVLYKGISVTPHRYRDLKPHNLLMDRKTMMLKIADLGLSRAFTIPLKKYTHEILTLWYRAPEMLLGATHYSTPVDMWSIGCIFAELVTTHALFPGDSELQQLLYIFRLLGTPTEEVWPGVERLSNWHEYPKWSPKSLSSAVPNLDADGLDLLSNRRVDLPNSAAPAALSKTLTTQTSETLLSDALFGDRPSALGSTPSLALEFGLMAEHLASIFGTEKDRVNCPFYFKIGACRHGDSDQTWSLQVLTGQPFDPQKIQEHFEDFYEDIFEELGKFGEIESLNVCDNLADHMIGNVYVQYREEEQAAAAMRALQGRFYSGRPIIVDFSPVTDFREATCRQFEENSCNRGGYCNFMHVKQIGRS